MRSALGAGTLAGVLCLAVGLRVGLIGEAPLVVLEQTERYTATLELPPPTSNGAQSLESVLERRRSGRRFVTEPLSMSTIGQLLWAGQGVTDEQGHRTAPSAGARYPIELYVVTADRLLHYVPDEHSVEMRLDTSTLANLGTAAFDQEFVSTAPAVIVVATVRSRTSDRYGDRATMFVLQESGHVAQNILLQATALDLHATPVGGFDAPGVERLLALPTNEEAVMLIPIGHPEGT